MKNNIQKTILSLSYLLLFLSINLTAQQTIISFDSYSSTPVNCNDQWEENGVLMYTADNQGSCFFGAETGHFWLYPSCLVIETGGIQNITSIEVDIQDFCGTGCTTASVLNGTTVLETQANTQGQLPETFIFDNPGITSVRLCSFEGVITEVRINYGEAECSITNVIAEAYDCDANGQFLVDVAFNVSNPTAANFQILGNGNNYGTFTYGQTFYTVGPLVGDGSTYEFVVQDVENPNCSNFTTLEAPICSTPECSITDLVLDPGNCDGQTYPLYVNFNYQNVLGATFDLYFNGAFFGFYNYSQLPLTINVPAGGTVDWVSVNDNDNPNCTTANEYEAPTCTEPCGNATLNQEMYINGTTVKISWSAVPDAIKYKIRYKEDGGTWTEVTTTDLEYTLSGLNPNSVYIYQIKVQCPEGYTTWSASHFIQTWADCPVPTGIEVQVISGNVVKICWTPVAQANNNYKIRYRKSNENTWSEYNLTGTCSNLSGLMPETGYVFQVKSKCDGLNSAWTGLEDFLTSASLCDRPTLEYVEPINNTDVILGWTAQPNATKYKYRYRAVGGTWSTTVTTSNTYSSILMLNPGEVYECQFKAKCGDFWTIWSPKYTFSASTFREQAHVGFNASTLTVFPNPAKEVIHFSSKNIEQCWITNINGNRVLEMASLDVNNEINIQHLQAGLYYLSVITTDQKLETKAFVKE